MIDKRKIQEINAGSMADIAFLLLIFFLVATTMNVDNGIQRMLPPMPPEDEKVDMDVKKRNLMLISISKFDQILAGGEQIDITQLKDKAKEFILNPRNDENMPERVVEKIDFIGDYPVSQGIVSLQNDRGTSYNLYIMVQNELTRAFTEVRDEVAMHYFSRKFADLDEDTRRAVAKAVPQKISEAEPRDIEGGR